MPRVPIAQGLRLPCLHVTTRSVQPLSQERKLGSGSAGHLHNDTLTDEKARDHTVSPGLSQSPAPILSPISISALNPYRVPHFTASLFISLG